MKYIDAEKLISEIQRLHKAHSGKYGCDEVGVNLEYLEDFITSLQQEQPEVDFEKEINAAHARFPEVSFAKLTRIAKRFYELGLNARKEE